MTITTQAVTLRDGNGAAFSVRAEYDSASASYAVHNVEEVGGAPVAVANPKPVAMVIGGNAVASGNPMPVVASAAAVTDESGSTQAMPGTISPNGTSLGILPAWARSLRFYLGSADTVTFYVGHAQPASPPPNTVTISGNRANGTGPNWDEPLAPGQAVYVTAYSGAPKFRFMA